MTFLNGIRVVDMTQMMSGPMASMYLGDLGAEVIKVERPDGGELTRDYGPFVDDVSAYFASLNRNKHCVTLNLAKEEGIEVLYDLIESADVVMENFKYGTAEKFGIDYESVHELNEDIIYCTINGFGSDSPYSNQPAFDMIAQAMGGAMSMTGEEDGPPVRTNVPIGDISAAMFAAISILTVLYGRDVAGQGGEYIEVPMLNSMIAWTCQRSTNSLLTGEPYPRTGTKHKEFAPYKNFETTDSYIVVGVASENLWPKFCNAIDRPDLIDDPRFETNAKRSENAEVLYGILDRIMASRTTREWFETMQEYGIPAGPVYDTLEVWEDPHTDQQDLLLNLASEDVDSEFPTVRYPANFGTELDEPYGPERIGVETETYLRELGYSEADINRLAENDVI